jgi:hypothetical protein
MVIGFTTFDAISAYATVVSLNPAQARCTRSVLEEARSGVGFMDSVPNVSLGTDVGGVEVSEKDVLGWLTFGKFCCCAQPERLVYLDIQQNPFYQWPSWS